MTPNELELAYSGYRQRVDEQWEMTRWNSYYSMIMHAKEDSLQVDKVFIPTDAMKPKEEKKLKPEMMMKVTPLREIYEQ